MKRPEVENFLTGRDEYLQYDGLVVVVIVDGQREDGPRNIDEEPVNEFYRSSKRKTTRQEGRQIKE